MDLKETCLRSEAVYDGCLLHARRDEVRLPDGGTSVREYLRHGGAVCVLPLTDDGRVVMERQYRYAAGRTVTELPAGKLERGEDPFNAMRREQREETGTVSERYVSLGVCYPTPAYDTEKIYLWAGRVSGWGEQELDDGELLEVERVPLAEAEQMVLRNEIADAKTQIGILKAAALVRTGAL